MCEADCKKVANYGASGSRGGGIGCPCLLEPMHDGGNQVGNSSIDQYLGDDRGNDKDSEQSNKHPDHRAALCSGTFGRVVLGMGDK